MSVCLLPHRPLDANRQAAHPNMIVLTRPHGLLPGGANIRQIPWQVIATEWNPTSGWEGRS
jgi:hypothetical protein